jgi:hypothetical protein
VERTMTNNMNHRKDKLIGKLKSHAKHQYIEQLHKLYMSSKDIGKLFEVL